jgi:Na+-transporting methylmalonyl-CoA/oxaloacetate decarboxylase gamma subunit
VANPSLYALIGAAVLSLVSFYAAFGLYRNLIARDGDAPGALQFIVLIFFIAGIFQMGVAAKATYDLQDSCETVVANETQIDNNKTTKEYKQVCFSTQGGQEKTTNQQAYWVTMSFFGLGLSLLFIHFLIVFMQWFKDRTTRGSH